MAQSTKKKGDGQIAHLETPVKRTHGTFEANWKIAYENTTKRNTTHYTSNKGNGKIPKSHKLPAPFYWDLWGNLDHLREAYQEWLAEDLFGPSSDEEEEDESSAVSWDTQ
jgi:hypothetical protein